MARLRLVPAALLGLAALLAPTALPQRLQVPLAPTRQIMSSTSKSVESMEQLEPRLLFSGDPLVAPQIIDDGGDGFAVVGSWGLDSGGGYEGDHLSNTAGGVGATATWTFTNLSPGYRYQVSATWTADAGQADGARYSVVNVVNSDIQNTLGTVSVDQTLAPDDFDESGTLWENLGDPYLIRGTTLSVQLTGAASDIVIADAIRIERVGQWVAPIGVPTPEFGIEESHWMYADPQYTYDYGSGPEAYRMGADGPYTHYVDNTHPDATDSSNPFGALDRPRLTIPRSPAAGSVVEVHGGPYVAATGWGHIYIAAQGTADHPIFFRGVSGEAREGRPRLALEVEVGHYADNSYLIFENLSFRKFGMYSRLHHIAVRHSDVSGDLGGGGIGAASYDDDLSLNHIVIYDTVIRDNGDWQATFDQDVHGIAVGCRVSNLWVVDNEMYHNSGDGIQINAGWPSPATQATTHHIYVGRNVSHHNKQSGFWTKQAVDVIFSQNTAYSHRPSDSSPGQGMGFQLAPENVWFLFNHIFDSDYGFYIGSNSGMGFGANSYFIGNVIHDIHHSGGYTPGSGWEQAAMMFSGGVYRHIIGNTIYDVDGGINVAGGGMINIKNNIISKVTEAEGRHIFIYHTATADASTSSNNLLYQDGASVRLEWSGGWTWDLATFQAQTGKGLDSFVADPRFVDAAGGDFRLRNQTGQVSPAIDAGASIQDYVALYSSLYGVDINGDFDGVPRPQGVAVDIGAFEAVSAPPAGDNEAPVASNLAVTTDEDTLVAGTVTATDADDDTLSFFVLGSPDHGSVEMGPDGSFTYTSDANWHGTDSFTFRAYDGWDYSSPATVTITVTGVNDDPVANDDTGTINSPVTIDVLSNDIDVDGDTLTVTGITQPAHGTVVDNGDGTLTYTLDAGYEGEDSFTYTISDGHGGTDTATVRVTFMPTAWANQDIGGVGAGGSASYSAAAGTYTVIGSGIGVRDSSDEFHYLYQTLDGDGEIYAHVLSVDNTYAWAQAGLMIRQSLDAGSQNVLMAITPTMGTSFQSRSIAGGGTSYTDPLDGVAAPYWLRLVRTGDTFSGYRSADGTNWSLLDSATIGMSETVYIGLAVSSLKEGGLCTAEFGNVTVIGGADPNQNPVAVNDSATTDEDTAVTVGVLANDTDPDEDALVISGFSDPAHGTVSDNGDGTLTYTPAANYHGSDSFTYTVSDGRGGTDTATVNVTVSSVNDDPVAVNDSAATDEDNAVTISVLASDTDVDQGDTLAVSSFTQATHGTVSDNGDGTLTYTPVANYHGSDSFTYTVSDGRGGTDTATVNVTVSSVNDTPVALDDTAVTPQNASIVVNVLDNDTDADGDTLTVVGITQAAGGSVANNGDGTLTYTPGAGFFGRDSFTYTVSDSNGGEATGTVDLMVGVVLPFGGRSKAEFRDATGDKVIVSLKGAGWGEVHLASNGRFDASRIVLGDTTNRSSVTISTKGRGSRTTVRNIAINGSLRSLTAKTTTLTGDITVTGVLGNLVLQDMTGAGGIEINTDGAPPEPRAQLSMRLDRVADSSIDTNGIPIRSLIVSQWLDGDGEADIISAPSLGTLTVRGNRRAGVPGHFQASLDLSGVGVSRATLNSARISGNVVGADWDIDGAVGRISVGGRVANWTLGANSNLRSLGSLSLGDVTSADVTVSGAVGSVSAKRWATGSLQARAIRSLRTSGDRRSGLAGDFGADLALSGSAARGPALGRATIAGAMTGVDWDIDGDMGSLKVGGKVENSTVRSTGSMAGLMLGAAVGSDFLAGCNLPGGVRHATADSDFCGQLTTMRFVRIIGVRGSSPAARFFSDSNFSAGTIGSVSLTNADFTNGGEFGLFARDAAGNSEIGSVTHQDRADTVNNWQWSPGNGSFPAKGQFVIRIL